LSNGKGESAEGADSYNCLIKGHIPMHRRIYKNAGLRKTQRREERVTELTRLASKSTMKLRNEK